MRSAAVLAVAALPFLVAAQEKTPKEDPTSLRLEVTGCVKGSLLTETSLRVSDGSREGPARRWRLRGPKAVMRQLKEQSGRELQIVGTMKNAPFEGGTRIGKTNIYIGGPTGQTGSPLPEQPTIDVESFQPTGESCR